MLKLPLVENTNFPVALVRITTLAVYGPAHPLLLVPAPPVRVVVVPPASFRETFAALSPGAVRAVSACDGGGALARQVNYQRAAGGKCRQRR